MDSDESLWYVDIVWGIDELIDGKWVPCEGRSWIVVPTLQRALFWPDLKGPERDRYRLRPGTEEEYAEWLLLKTTN